jgi:hypothetical protein
MPHRQRLPESGTAGKPFFFAPGPAEIYKQGGLEQWASIWFFGK